MAIKGVGKEVQETEREKGHYRAYGTNGKLLWEKKDFTIGVDNIPSGLSDGMKCMKITDGKKILKKWDPWGLLP